MVKTNFLCEWPSLEYDKYYDIGYKIWEEEEFVTVVVANVWRKSWG